MKSKKVDHSDAKKGNDNYVTNNIQKYLLKKQSEVSAHFLKTFFFRCVMVQVSMLAKIHQHQADADIFSEAQ